METRVISFLPLQKNRQNEKKKQKEDKDDPRFPPINSSFDFPN